MQLKTLQQGRGLAAIAVAAFHLSLLLGLPRYLGDPVFHDVTRRGNLGVDFFFVLSGFIIVFAHVDDIGRPQRLPSYLLKRFIRLFPIYWVYTAIFCGLMQLGFGGNSIAPHNLSNWVSTIFLVRLDNFELPITPGWTLMHELTFYLVFATLIVNRLWGSAILVAWLMIGGILFQYAEEGARQPATTYFSPLNFNFLIGMGAFYAWRGFHSPALKYAFPAGGLLFIAVYVLESRGLPYRLTQIPYALSFGLLIAGATAWERDGFKASRFNPLTLIGNASYSIYLTHLAFIGLYIKIYIKIFGVNGGATAQAVYFITLAATVFSGCLIYLLVERPLLTACRSWLAPRTKREAVPIETRA